MFYGVLRFFDGGVSNFFFSWFCLIPLAKMHNAVFVLACLVARAAANPSVTTSNGNVIVKGQDLRFTPEDASAAPISFIACE